MAMFAGLAYAAGGDNTRRDALWGVVMAHKAMKKSNWREEDVQAFEMVDSYTATPPPNPDIEILYILKRMAQLRGTPKESAASLVADLKERTTGFVPDDAARALLIQAEMFRVDGETDSVLRCTEEALSFKGSLSPRMLRDGLLAEIWFTRSVACIAVGRFDEAKVSLNEINKDLMKPMSKADRMDFDFRKVAVGAWLVDTEGHVPDGAPASVMEANEDAGFWSADEDEADMDAEALKEQEAA
jgi:hypothetical protein